jgi:hypothetical protein
MNWETERCLDRRGPSKASDSLLLSPYSALALTPEAMVRLRSFPANQFVLRDKAGRRYYVYADPTECGCAYIGSVGAMDKYRATFAALPADTLSSSGFTNPEQNIINSMDNDDAGARFNKDVFGPDF